MGIVAIVGRPNVGKSTLFNRLVGMRQAIVDSTAGTTRDRHYGRTDWNGREFSVIDTGGYTVNGEDVFEEEIRRQVMLAIDEADVILFMTEVSTGITDLDMFMADILRRAAHRAASPFFHPGRTRPPRDVYRAHSVPPERQLARLGPVARGRSGGALPQCA